MLLVFGLGATASAYPGDGYDRHRHHDWSRYSYHENGWARAYSGSVSVRWFGHRNMYAADRYGMERIHDRQWHDRFPGLRAYNWHDRNGEGFWYRGHRVTDAVFFYNDDDELVSIGFMHRGAFVFIREDQRGFENRDSFFLSWWHRG
jgi:hypothetical protein